jgi:flagellar hook-associated protein FlgK
MSDILSISSNAVTAYQSALSTVSNNIANVSTDGYSREEVVMKDTAPTQLGNSFVGTGVMVATIKRDFDTFVAQNLRDSNSDLSAQTPMVNYSQQVMNTMADQTMGLSSALDKYFSAANALSSDPASTVQRNSFLQSAGGVASRFAELSGQLSSISSQATQALKDDVAQFNTLTSQLAVINKSLMKSPTLESQPASLLDSRDLTLSKLSNLMKINTSFSPNGIVTVSLGASSNSGVVVDSKGNSTSIGVNTQSPGNASLMLDPYGAAQPLPNASGGEIAGYQNVMSQVIQPTQANLDKLAQTFVTEANKVQTNGIDGYGAIGQNLFSIDTTASSPAAGVNLALTDPMRVATASQFGVTQGKSNVGSASASVSYSGTTPATPLSNTQLVNNPNPAAAVTFNVGGATDYTPVTTLSAGVGAVFYLDSAAPGQQLQVMTKDGRQVLGQALTQTQELQMMTTANGFAANATYSSQYLNQSGANAYRGIDMFYGAKASVQNSPVYDKNGIAVGTTPLPADLLTNRITGTQNIPAGALTLNGVSLGQFTSPKQSTVSISGLGLVPAGDNISFNFNAIVDGKQVSVPISAADASNMSTLQTSLNAGLQPFGLNAQLANNGQDLTVTDPLNRDISDVSLAPVSQVSISGLSFPSTAAAPFSFTAQVNGQNYSISNFSSTNISDLAVELQSKLTHAGLTGLSVSTSGGNLVIKDPMGRSFTSATFTTTSTDPAVSSGLSSINDPNNVPGSNAPASIGATAGNVTINTDAQQIAQWINGSSQANFSGVSFDVRNLQPFAQFSGTIGGTSFSFSNLTSTDLPSLAAELQTDLRAQDGGSSNISVSYSGNNLQVTDALGRNLSNFALTPPTGGSSAQTSGTVSLTQSTQSQTGVHAVVTSNITVPLSQLDLSKPLSLNGQTISGYSNYTDLVTAINQSPAGLQASTNSQGELVITDLQGGTIHVDPTPSNNALNVGSGSYPAQVSMVKVVPDMTIAATSVNFNNPLQINGVNFGQATYNLPAAGTPFSTEFGTVSNYDPTTLQNVLNDKSSQTISGVSLGNPAIANAIQSFSVNVGGQTFTLNNLSPQGNSMSNLAAEIQSKLQAADNSTNLTVSVGVAADGSNTLVVKDNSQPSPRNISGMALTLSAAGAMAQGNTGTVQPRFSDSFVASVSGSKLTVTALDPNMTDGDIASKVFVQSNGSLLPSQSSMSSMQDLLARFASLQSRTGVVASLDQNGDLKLTTTDPTAQATISVGPGKDASGNFKANALNMTPQDYDPSKRLQLKLAADPTYNTDIKMSFGTYGTPPNTQFGDPSMLGSLGLRTGAYIEGGSTDDLMVFVTGKGSAQVSTSFSGQPANQRDSLRNQSLEVKFTAAGQYSIIDAKTNTVLAQRSYDPSVTQPEIDYQGLKISLSSTPTVGDTYTINGNFDGTGNNVNMLDMVSLAKSPVANGKSIGDNYIDQVNSVGNTSQQATITQQALKAVNAQAVTAQSNVSGVSLDSEAASLIRYQQAYQAAAKALQVSGQLFDSIVQIR